MAAGVYQVTVTGQTGPGQTATAVVLTDVESINFRVKDGAVDIKKLNGPSTTFEYSNIATVTVTPASKTMVLST